MYLTKAQKDVMEKVRENLQDRPWFSGVCCDNFPTDKVCRENFDEAVTQVEMETAYWDAPNFWNP